MPDQSDPAEWILDLLQPVIGSLGHLFNLVPPHRFAMCETFQNMVFYMLLSLYGHHVIENWLDFEIFMVESKLSETEGRLGVRPDAGF